MKSSDAQTDPGIDTIYFSDDDSEVGVSEACEEEKKKDDKLLLDSGLQQYF